MSRIDPEPDRFIDEDVLHAVSCLEPSKREHSKDAFLGCVLKPPKRVPLLC